MQMEAKFEWVNANESNIAQIILTMLSNGNGCALRAWVSLETRNASTHGIVLNNGTLSVVTACSRAWVYAAFIFTRSIAGTFRVLCAFRSARWRAANVVGNARACSLRTNHATL